MKGRYFEDVGLSSKNENVCFITKNKCHFRKTCKECDVYKSYLLNNPKGKDVEG